MSPGRSEPEHYKKVSIICGGVEFKSFNPKTGRLEYRRIYFPMPKAVLPVVGPKGASLVTWGKREKEFTDLDVPRGGWARLDSLEAGKWRRFSPKPVIIPVSQFMEKDKSGTSHWFKLEDNQVIQGIGINVGGQPFVYVVTIPGEANDVHERKPKVITLEEARQFGDFQWQEEWPWQKPPL